MKSSITAARNNPKDENNENKTQCYVTLKKNSKVLGKDPPSTRRERVVLRSKQGQELILNAGPRWVWRQELQGQFGWDAELSSSGRMRVHQNNLTAPCPLSPGEVIVHTVKFSTHIK